MNWRNQKLGGKPKPPPPNKNPYKKLLYLFYYLASTILRYTLHKGTQTIMLVQIPKHQDNFTVLMRQ